ncbi:MAG: hypothetical protein ABFD84_14685 [Candidatus Polarisedimenticolia bacterium]|nr:hypothetical protein [bacterium]
MELRELVIDKGVEVELVLDAELVAVAGVTALSRRLASQLVMILVEQRRIEKGPLEFSLLQYAFSFAVAKGTEAAWLWKENPATPPSRDDIDDLLNDLVGSRVSEEYQEFLEWQMVDARELYGYVHQWFEENGADFDGLPSGTRRALREALAAAFDLGFDGGVARFGVEITRRSAGRAAGRRKATTGARSRPRGRFYRVGRD